MNKNESTRFKLLKKETFAFANAEIARLERENFNLKELNDFYKKRIKQEKERLHHG